MFRSSLNLQMKPFFDDLIRQYSQVLLSKFSDFLPFTIAQKVIMLLSSRAYLVTNNMPMLTYTLHVDHHHHYRKVKIYSDQIVQLSFFILQVYFYWEILSQGSSMEQQYRKIQTKSLMKAMCTTHHHLYFHHVQHSGQLRNFYSYQLEQN